MVVVVVVVVVDSVVVVVVGRRVVVVSPTHSGLTCWPTSRLQEMKREETEELEITWGTGRRVTGGHRSMGRMGRHKSHREMKRTGENHTLIAF